ncbi:MAG: RluA family pseudouridine synthase [Ruminiclostridium sp.]|nr:RluA family pseudouridine synthase [Ruminiclostridium sp.]
MKQVTVNKNAAGQRIDRFLTKTYPELSQGFICKTIRKKDIKVNGKRTEANYKLIEGDVITLYVKDELFEKKKLSDDDFLATDGNISVIYEDENIILVDKETGLVVHEDNDNTADTLINRIKNYLYRKGEYNPAEEFSFAPALCNRIDRNTGGIVIAAKNAESLRILNQKVKDRELTKLYLCAVNGVPKVKSARLTAYLYKNEKENRVIISDKKTPQNRTIVTAYKVLEERGGDSLLEVDLITGRTHQIRAHMAYMGHFLLGDGKYGVNKINREKGYPYQALYSYKLVFNFSTDGGILNYLNGKEFTARNIWFLEQFRKGEKR